MADTVKTVSVVWNAVTANFDKSVKSSSNRLSNFSKNAARFGNRFVGGFPSVVLKLPNLKYLDIRYNDFEGPLPPKLFENDLDAIFMNNNRFTSIIPDTLGKSKASVVIKGSE